MYTTETSRKRTTSIANGVKTTVEVETVVKKYANGRIETSENTTTTTESTGASSSSCKNPSLAISNSQPSKSPMRQVSPTKLAPQAKITPSKSPAKQISSSPTKQTSGAASTTTKKASPSPTKGASSSLKPATNSASKSPISTSVSTAPKKPQASATNSALGTGLLVKPTSKAEIEGFTPATDSIMVEHDVVAYVNLLRTKPHLFIPLLESMKQFYQGNSYVVPGQTTLSTNEGYAAVQEAIDALRNTKPMKPLKYVVGLSLGGRDHNKDTGPSGLTGHYGTDRSDPSARVKRYANTFGAGENISYGYGDSAQKIVMQLFIDDGVPSRGHRTNLLDPTYVCIGVAVGPHKTYGHMCTMNFTKDNATDKSPEITAKIRQPNAERTKLIENATSVVLRDVLLVQWFPVDKKTLEDLVNNFQPGSKNGAKIYGTNLDTIISPIEPSGVIPVGKSVNFVFAVKTPPQKQADMVNETKWYKMFKTEINGKTYYHGSLESAQKGTVACLCDNSYVFTLNVA